MANPLFVQFGRQQNPFSALINEVESFKNTFSGSPKEEVQRLLNSGQMSQEQFNRFSQVVQQMAPYMGRK